MNWILIADLALDALDRVAMQTNKDAEASDTSKLKKTQSISAGMLLILIIIRAGQKMFESIARPRTTLLKLEPVDQSAPDFSGEMSSMKSTSVVMFALPVEGDIVITDTFGIEPTSYRDHKHGGIDIRANKSKLFATENNGKVVAVGHDKRSGNFVTIEYNRDGYSYRVAYCHLQEATVKVGDTVNAGQLIAISGNTGSSTAPHLHLTVKRKVQGRKKYE